MNRKKYNIFIMFYRQYFFITYNIYRFFVDMQISYCPGIGICYYFTYNPDSSN